jgi:hypothetical protein
MTEAAGLYTGVVALYSACRDCHIFFNNIKNAEKKAFLQIRELGLQEAILRAWGRYWEIDRHQFIISDDKGEQYPKLARYLGKNYHKAKSTTNTLFAIAEALSDEEKLLTQYGISIELNRTESYQNANIWKAPSLLFDPIRTSLEDVRGHMRRYTQDCKWVLKDQEKFKKLISDLKSHNDSLYMSCPDGAAEAMYLYLAVDYLAPRTTQMGLMMTARATDHWIQGEEIGLSQKGIEVLADAARIKAKSLAIERQSSAHSPQGELITIPEKDLVFLENDIAVWKKGKQVVYLERRKHAQAGYEDSGLYPPKDDLLKLGRQLVTIQSLKRLLSLDCIGLIHLGDTAEIGYVYKLPGRLGKYRPLCPLEDTEVRRRIGVMQNHLGWSPSLGGIFRIAKKIISAVALLHASGWLHRNIRRDVVFHIPRDEKEMHLGMLDYEADTPFISGYSCATLADQELQAEIPVTGDTTRLNSAGDLSASNAPQNNAGNVSDYPGSNASTLADFHYESRVSPNISLNIYQHPARRRNPGAKYRHAYDVYSLGMVLLELGLWSNEFGQQDPYNFRRYILRKRVPLLENHCGKMYRGAVERCLTVDSDDDPRVLSEKRSLCAKIAADISQCWA